MKMEKLYSIFANTLTYCIMYFILLKIFISGLSLPRSINYQLEFSIQKVEGKMTSQKLILFNDVTKVMLFV